MDYIPGDSGPHGTQAYSVSSTVIDDFGQLLR